MFDTHKVKIAVIGDFCLDVYWYADMTKSILSRETPHYPLPVVREVMSPGGAGNVTANISALEAECVYALGTVGNDWRGDCLVNSLEKNGVSTQMLVRTDGRFTNAYIKPCKFGLSGKAYEDERIDFEADKALSDEHEALLLENLEKVKDSVDAICVCDQMKYGCITDTIRERLCEIGRAGKTVIVDSRERIALYRDVIVKPNDIEAARATGISDPKECAKKLSEMTHRPTIVTCGEKGCVVCENGKAVCIPAFHKDGEKDICGAGDTFLSALAVFSSCGSSLADAARFANAASCVTVHKVGTTGTASLEEILALIEK